MTVRRVPSFLRSGDGRVRLRGVRTLKTTLAAVVAYVAAFPVSDNPRPVLAPLTALLVVQLTLYDTLRAGMRRVVGVTAGVLVAVGLSAWVPLTWWSLGLAVAASLVVGRLLRLGPEVAEVPISAMLVLAVGGADVAAEGRVLETIVGAVVGVLVGSVIAPPLYVRPAAAAVQDLARSTAEALRTVSREVRGEYDAEQALRWLEMARGLGRDILRADRELERAETSLRLNPRSLKRPNVGVSLRTGLEALERATVSLRGVARSLSD
ncbi:MAG: FUSC family protein, partial [Actinomycetes bacterium]